MTEVARLQATLGADTSNLEAGLNKSVQLLGGAEQTQKSILQRMQLGTASLTTAMSSGFAAMSGNYAQAGAMLRALPGPIGVVAGAAGEMFGRAIEETIVYANEMSKASVVTGASVEFISQFVEAADDQFISQEAVVASLTRFSKALGGATDLEGGFIEGGRGVTQVLQDLGIKFDTSAGSAAMMEQALPQLADIFQQMGPGVKATTLAMQLFGKSGADMLPVLLQGRVAMEASMKAAKDMGLAMTTEAAAAVKRLKTQQDGLNDSWAAMGRTISVSVIPTLGNVVGGMSEYMARAQAAGFGTEQLSLTFQFLTGQMNTAAAATEDAAAAIDTVGAAAVRSAGELNMIASATFNATGAMGGMVGQVLALRAVTQESYSPYSRNAVLMRDMATAANETSAAWDKLAKGGGGGGGISAVTQAQNDLAASVRNVQGAMFGSGEAMNKQALAQAAYSLATGQTTVAQFESERAAAALGKSYTDGQLTLEQLTAASMGLATGALSSQAAFVIAGAAGEEYAKQLGPVEAAADAAKLAVANMVPDIPPAKGQKAGAQLAAGLAQGIGGDKTTAAAFLLLVDKAVAAVNTAYESHSPSGRTAREVGVPLALGVAEGFKSAQGDISGALIGGIMQSVVAASPWIVTWGTLMGTSLIDSILLGMKTRTEQIGTGAGSASTTNSGNPLPTPKGVSSTNTPAMTGTASIYIDMGDVVERRVTNIVYAAAGGG